MRVLVFGASTVQGYWDKEGGWADRLKHYYDNIQMSDFSVEQPRVMNLGISGDGSSELLKRINSEAAARQNEKGLSIVISIGSNSAAVLNGNQVSSTEKFVSEYEEIISLTRKYTNKILLVGLPAVDESKTTPIAWVDMHFKNDRIAEFESAVKMLAEREGLPFVEIHSTMMRSEKYLQSHDGLHPNDAGHQLIFELVRPVLDELINT